MATKKTSPINKRKFHVITLPDKKINIGPGTVPSYSGSASYTNIPEVLNALRKAAREGTFELKEPNPPQYNG